MTLSRPEGCMNASATRRYQLSAPDPMLTIGWQRNSTDHAGGALDLPLTGAVRRAHGRTDGLGAGRAG